MQRISCQLAVTLIAITSSQALRLHMAERRERPQDAGIADEHVELP